MRIRRRMLGCGGSWLGILLAVHVQAEDTNQLLQAAEEAARLEASMAAPLLLDENEQLRSRLDQLDAQVTELTVLLAETRAALDQAQVKGEQLSGFAGASGADERNRSSRRVRDVNRELELVVIDGGADDGLRTGLVLAVLRGDRVVARVRVVDVRNKISGARMETVLGDEYPQQGDRLIVWRSSME